MFFKLFKNFKDPEAEKIFRERYETYVAMGYSTNIARNLAKQIVRRAMEVCKKESKYGEKPDPFYLFNKAREDNEVAAYLAAIKKEGVTEEDIKEWYSLSPLERAVLEIEDGAFRTAAFLHEIEKKKTDGFEEEEAAKEAAIHVRRHFPIWGDPRDTTHTEGDDRPLPIELKLRELRWRMKQLQDPVAFNIKLHTYSSYNAMVRAVIRKGEL